ncbi:hypothetical protein CERSUDRAFT_109630 [Gelatoporia subvermispora B]|uniref:DUF6534 domain-containing protein n=1 Tax=Ceriporiopsis subvermispora (strain B) TaxID=914234 RepID=M2QYS4_CERS8|nr:hypothetical protein CERSUDRAFT_109630 [Gelatoporia subvermispora B]
MSIVPSQSTLNGTFGALYGITNIQTYIYFRRYPNDRIILKMLILDTVHQALTTHSVYTTMVTRWGSPDAFGSVLWSRNYYYPSIFARRLWNFSGRRYCVITPQWGVYVGLGVSVVADLWLTGSLVIILHKRRTRFRHTDSMLRMLTMYCVNCAAITSTCEVVLLITTSTMPNNLIYYPFLMCIPKLFLNSLLAFINARQDLREISSSPVRSTAQNTKQYPFATKHCAGVYGGRLLGIDGGQIRGSRRLGCIRRRV